MQYTTFISHLLNLKRSNLPNSWRLHTLSPLKEMFIQESSVLPSENDTKKFLNSKRKTETQKQLWQDLQRNNDSQHKQPASLTFDAYLTKETLTLLYPYYTHEELLATVKYSFQYYPGFVGAEWTKEDGQLQAVVQFRLLKQLHHTLRLFNHKLIQIHPTSKQFQRNITVWVHYECAQMISR